MTKRQTMITVGFLLIALVGIAEGGARLWLAAHPDPAPDPVAFYLTRRAPYANSVYWSPDFVREQWAIQWDTRDGWWQPDDFTGKYYNTANGSRRVTGQPATGSAVYLMGNSPAFDFAVPDEYTIASQLQAMLPDRRVFNLGGNGNAIQSELSRLKILDLQPGDTVIFYDGTAEAYNAWAKADADGARLTPGLCRGFISHRWLALVKLLCPLSDQLQPDMLQAAAIPIATDYRQTVIQARDYVTQHGARFIHAIQPNLYTRPLSAYEQTLDVSRDITLPGMAGAFAAVYSLLAQPGDLDLTHALDAMRAAGNEIYLNCCHVNEQADAVIAQALFKVINEPSAR